MYYMFVQTRATHPISSPITPFWPRVSIPHTYTHTYIHTYIHVYIYMCLCIICSYKPGHLTQSRHLSCRPGRVRVCQKRDRGL